jgi:HlyD family secretion protein
MRRNRLIAIAVLAGVAALVAGRALHTNARVQVITMPITVGPIQRDILTTGTLQATTTVQVGTQLSGTIQSVSVDYNSLVHKGEVLARLDPASYQADLEHARAALTQAQADLENARATAEDAQTKLVRAKESIADELITPADLEDATVAADTANEGVKSAAAQIVVAKAAVDQAVLNLAHTVIASPIDGIVVSRNVDPGQTVAATLQSPTLFVVAPDLARMQLQATIDEADVGGVRTGDRASFTLDAYPDSVFYGKVTQVRLQPVDESSAGGSGGPGGNQGSGGSQVGAGGGSAQSQAQSTAPQGVGSTFAGQTSGTVVAYTAIIDVANPGEKLRPGMTAIITLPGMRKDSVVRIPNAALTFEPTPGVLQAVDGRAAIPAQSPSPSDHTAKVWSYTSGLLKPVIVQTGLADDRWTELVGGPLHPNDALATGVSIAP